jgi:hypothetical protein
VIAARTLPQVFRAALFTSSTIVLIAAAHRLAVRWIGRIAVKPERLERAIADDVAWLAAHPTRRGPEQPAEQPS